jgi:anti-sigma B factor antagonist
VNRIEVSRYDNGVAAIKLLGEHDMSTRGDLYEALNPLLAQGQRVIVDLSDTEFIDSSVLHALVSSDQHARNNGHRLTLQLNTKAIVKRVLEIGGILDHLPCGATREQAIELAWANHAGSLPTKALAEIA